MDTNIVSAELVKSLTAEIAHIVAGPYQIGLYTNDLDNTVRTHVIGDITPCAGAGYSGLQDLDDWGSITFVSPIATCSHSGVVWTFDGSATRTIRGFYVVDALGALAWWLKIAGSGTVVGTFAGQTFTAFPIRTRGSNP